MSATSGLESASALPAPQLPSAAAASGSARPKLGSVAQRYGYVPLVRLGDAGIGLLALLGGFLGANLGSMPIGLDEFLELRLTVRNLLLLAGFLVVWRFLGERTGLYDPRRIRSFSQEALRVSLVCGFGTMAAMVFPLISRSGAFSPTAVVYFGVVAGAGLLLLRVVLRAITLTGAPAIREILIVGIGPRAQRAYLELQADRDNSNLVLGFVDLDQQAGSEEARRHWVGPLNELESILMRRPVDEVLIALPIRSQYSEIQQAIEVCWRLGVRCKYLADVFDSGRARTRIELGERVATVSMAVAPEDGRLLVKRALDVVGALIGLVAFAPVLAVAAVAVKLTSPGPVLFSQERHGLHKRRFRMHKLRTMYADAETRQAELEAQNEASGPVFKIRRDPRVTPVGRLLRRTSLDELPQLWNVLQGDMSLVGPRPLPVRDVQRFTEGALMRRFSVRPGVTGLWQVSARDSLVFDDWVRSDMQYIDEWSLTLDCRILARTLPAVVRGSGAD